MNRRKKAIIALTFLVAAAVGFESWQAAAEAAKTGGRPHPMLWPVTLEAFIAVLVLVYWEARSEGRKPTAARLLLAGVTLLASTVQVLDVLAGTATGEKLALGIITAAWTPIALNLTVEFATWLLYGKPAPANPPAGVGERTLERPTTSSASAPRASARAAAPRPRSADTAVKAERGRPQTSPRVPLGEAAPGGSTPDTASVRLRVLREHLKEHPAASLRELEAKLGEQGIGVGNRTKFGQDVNRIKTEGNGHREHAEVDA